MTVLRPTPPPTGPRPELRRPAVLGTILFGYPLLSALIGATFMVVWAPQLPEPVATQWNGDQASSTMPLIGAIALFLIVQLGDGALFGLIGLHGLRTGMPMRAARGVAALTTAITTFIAVLMPATIGLQRGLADAAESDGGAVGLWAGIAAVAAAASAGIAALLLPRQPDPEPVEREEQPASLRLSAQERALWIARMRAPDGLIAVLVLPILACAALPLLLDGPPVLSLVPLLVAAAAGLLCCWRIRVDHRGIAVRSLAGWPGWTFRLDDIVAARVVEVNALGEFGGWGVRFGRDGRWGLILRSGQALEVQRVGRRRFVVTVDGADDAAALLNGLRERA